jgi:hypothetical protein
MKGVIKRCCLCLERNESLYKLSAAEHGASDPDLPWTDADLQSQLENVREMLRAKLGRNPDGEVPVLKHRCGSYRVHFTCRYIDTCACTQHRAAVSTTL